MIQVQFRSMAVSIALILSVIFFARQNACDPSSVAGTFLELYVVSAGIGAANLFLFLPKNPKREPIRPSEIQVRVRHAYGLKALVLFHYI